MRPDMDTSSSQNEARQISVVIVEDHGVVRAGLRRLLDESGEAHVVGDAGTARDGLELVEIKRPDVVLLDIDLPDRNGLELVADVLAKSKGSKVLILSMHDSVEYVEEAFSAGVHGYLLKEAADSELLSAVRAVVQGGRYVYPLLGARLAEAAIGKHDDPLTDREREIARLLALGHTNHEVAQKLFLSVRTVETHRAHLMAKLHLHGRADLVQWALDNGLLKPSSRPHG